MLTKTSDRSLRALRTFFVAVYLLVSLAFLPFLGDSIREPKWIFLWLTAPFLLAMLLAFHAREYGAFLRRLPWYLSLPVIYFLAQGFLLTSVPHFIFFCISFFAIMIIASGGVFLYVKAPHLFHARGVRYAFYGAVFLHVILALLQALNLDPIFELKNSTFARSLAGFMGHHTFFGLLMAFIAMLGLTINRKLIFAIGAVFCVASLSSTAAATLVTAFAIYLFWQKKYIYPSLLLVGAGCYSGYRMLNAQSDFDYFNDNGRVNIWIMVLRAVNHRPWFGYGINSFSYEFPYQQGFLAAPWIQAHNEYLELLFCGGIVGFSLSLLLLPPLWKRRKLWWRRADAEPFFFTLTVVLINSLANFPLHIAPFALYALTSYIYLVTYEPTTEVR